MQLAQNIAVSTAFPLKHSDNLAKSIIRQSVGRCSRSTRLMAIGLVCSIWGSYEHIHFVQYRIYSKNSNMWSLFGPFGGSWVTPVSPKWDQFYRLSTTRVPDTFLIWYKGVRGAQAVSNDGFIQKFLFFGPFLLDFRGSWLPESLRIWSILWDNQRPESPPWLHVELSRFPMFWLLKWLILTPKKWLFDI